MILSIARKELKSMFASPMGWIILALVMYKLGDYYLQGVNDYLSVMSGSMRPAERVGVTAFISQSVYGLASFIMLFAVPLLSMRLIAEERRNQTLPFLLSAPLSITEIVIGKFLGLVGFLSILIIYIAVMLTTLKIWAEIDFGYIFANSLGLFLLTASFSALGLYFSSLTSQPVVAAILSFIALFAFMMLGQLSEGDLANVMSHFSLMSHFKSFGSGLLDTGDIAYFLLFITTFIVLTIRRLDADRLRG